MASVKTRNGNVAEDLKVPRYSCPRLYRRTNCRTDSYSTGLKTRGYLTSRLSDDEQTPAKVKHRDQPSNVILTIPHSNKIKDVFDERKRITRFRISPRAIAHPSQRTDAETKLTLSNLLTLGIAQASLTLRSLNRNFQTTNGQQLTANNQQPKAKVKKRPDTST